MSYSERGRLILIGLSAICIVGRDLVDIYFAGGLLVGVIVWQIADALSAQSAGKEGGK